MLINIHHQTTVKVTPSLHYSPLSQVQLMTNIHSMSSIVLVQDVYHSPHCHCPLTTVVHHTRHRGGCVRSCCWTGLVCHAVHQAGCEGVAGLVCMVRVVYRAMNGVEVQWHFVSGSLQIYKSTFPKYYILIEKEEVQKRVIKPRGRGNSYIFYKASTA